MSSALSFAVPFVPHVGALVDQKYVLTRRIGSGGMGEVWSARHCALGHELAVKFLILELDDFTGNAGHDASLSRFQLEARLAANLSRRTKHIASVFDFGMEGATAYLVMELIEGVCLEAVIGEGEHRDLGFVATVISQLALGLSVAHGHGVVHRDLKPGNVMLVRGDEPGTPLVKILDFGIGKVLPSANSARTAHPAPALVRHRTRYGVPIGTPEYMSPEQGLAHGDVDYRCDVWALAVVAYEMLTGVCPFEGASIGETMARVRTRSGWSVLVHRPDLPEAATRLFETAFALDLDERFRSALAFSAALSSLAEAAEVQTSSGTPRAVKSSICAGDPVPGPVSRVRPCKTTEPG